MARFPLLLDPSHDGPLFLRIARALIRDIGRGRLAPGARLPGSRALARELGVHRNTVVAALDELTAEGWLTSGERRGTYVAHDLPIARLPAPASPRGAVGFELPRPAPRLPPPAITLPAVAPGALVMSGGMPDLRLFPAAALARAYRQALARHAPDVLGYGDPRGDRALREALARMLAEQRALALGPDELLITHGAQEALALLGQILGDPTARGARAVRIAVEAYGYRPAWMALAAGARLAPVPVDRDGLDVEALAREVAARPIRALYVTPHHQFPTMATLGAPRRLALLALAARERFAVIEDDYDHEVHYEGRPIAPLASADRAGVVLYVGTLSKVLAPGLRLGFLAGPPEVLARAAELRLGSVRQGDLAHERAVAALLADGEVERHVRRMRRRYALRRQVLTHELARRLGGVVSHERTAGGLALWLRVADDVDAEAWTARAAERGVLVAPGRLYRFDGAPSPHLRVGFGCLDERELVEAVARLAAALPRRAAARGRTAR